MPLLRRLLTVVFATLPVWATAQSAPPAPATLPNAQSFTFRELPDQPLRLHVFRPDGHRNSDRRPALVFFFGGAWTRGTPDRAAGWARLAASWGMVGIAPDYRTKDRFGTSPVEAVADARRAVRWVQEHAADLGVDPARVVVGGNSAGAHLALWTALSPTPFGSAADEDPLHPPAGLILVSAPTNLTDASTIRRFGASVVEVSPLQKLTAGLPPMLMFHGDKDTVVPHQQAVDLEARLTELGNRVVFVSVPGGSHGFASDLPEWRDRSRSMIKLFLEREGLLPVP